MGHHSHCKKHKKKKCSSSSSTSSNLTNDDIFTLKNKEKDMKRRWKCAGYSHRDDRKIILATQQHPGCYRQFIGGRAYAYDPRNY